MNTLPFEVIAAPATVYFADAGTAMPDIDADLSVLVAWTKVGSSGSLNYDDASGIALQPEQTTVPWMALGDSAARKIFRTAEGFKVRLKLVDITVEQLALALNHNSVTTVPPGPGNAYRKVGLSRGFNVATKALLIRWDVSPYLADGKSQFYLPRAAQTGNPTDLVAKKGEPMGVQLEWTALVDPNAADDERLGVFAAESDDT